MRMSIRRLQKQKAVCSFLPSSTTLQICHLSISVKDTALAFQRDTYLFEIAWELSKSCFHETKDIPVGSS